MGLTPEQEKDLRAAFKAELDKIEEGWRTFAVEMKALRSDVAQLRADVKSEVTIALAQSKAALGVLSALTVVMRRKDMITDDELKAEVRRLREHEAERSQFWKIIGDAGLGGEDVSNT